MKIVFHGKNAATFQPGFRDLVGDAHEIVAVPDKPTSASEVDAFRTADVLIGVALDPSLPRPERVRLYHAPAAGVDAIDRACLPAGTPLCCCFGHEQAIAEYVMTALLMRHVPIAAADQKLRARDWSLWPGAGAHVRSELGSHTLGLLGYGHIGRAVAKLGKAFGMRITACNRSPVSPDGIVEQSFGLDRMPEFMALADYIVVSLPQLPSTTGIVNARAIGAMRPHGVIVNVGRGPVIDEAALFAALKSQRIGGAIIDTWWVYPSADKPAPWPGTLPFHELDNCVLTSHMSGWTSGTIRRRQETMADNIRRLAAGQSLQNVV
jgi:phosphoglycerate dehydrogenase-like enzyme